MSKHVSQEIRRMETKKKIIDAAIELFSTKGYYQTNSKEIVKNAGVSIGSFYTYFLDKKALLIDVLNTYIVETIPVATEQGFSDVTISEDRKGLLKKLIENCFEYHHFTKGFYQQVTMLSAIDEEIGMVFNQYQNSIYDRIKAILMVCYPTLPVSSQDAAAIIIYSAIEGSIHSVRFSKSNIEESQLIHELVGFIEGYFLTFRG